jgi:hypothetical protein
MAKVALITGVTGQDGAYLAELLLQKGYVVHGLRRRSSSFNSGRIEHLYRDLHSEDVRFFLHYGDLTDATNLIRLIQQIQPTRSTISQREPCLRELRDPESTGSALFACSKRCESSAWRRRRASIRRRPPSFTARQPRRRSANPCRSIHAVPYGVAKLYAY